VRALLLLALATGCAPELPVALTSPLYSVRVVEGPLADYWAPEALDEQADYLVTGLEAEGFKRADLEQTIAAVFVHVEPDLIPCFGGQLCDGYASAWQCWVTAKEPWSSALRHEWLHHIIGDPGHTRHEWRWTE
jgi:hypothetical protein